jgi:hypothetical protein
MIKEIIKEYQHRMGWNDQSMISILCDYIEIVEPTRWPGVREHLEQRAREEEQMTEGEDA